MYNALKMKLDTQYRVKGLVLVVEHTTYMITSKQMVNHQLIILLNYANFQLHVTGLSHK